MVKVIEHYFVVKVEKVGRKVERDIISWAQTRKHARDLIKSYGGRKAGYVIEQISTLIREVR